MTIQLETASDRDVPLPRIFSPADDPTLRYRHDQVPSVAAAFARLRLSRRAALIATYVGGPYEDPAAHPAALAALRDLLDRKLLTADEMLELTQTSSSYVADVLLNHPETPARIVKAAALQAPHTIVRLTAVRTSRIGSKHLHALADDDSPVIRHTVASLRGLPTRTARKLACDPMYLVAEAVANNPTVADKVRALAALNAAAIWSAGT
jgi:hypothetical protein